MNNNGSVKFAGIFVTIAGIMLGLVVGVYTWSTSVFATKGETNMIYNAILEVKADQREIKLDIKEISKVINSR